MRIEHINMKIAIKRIVDTELFYVDATSAIVCDGRMMIFNNSGQAIETISTSDIDGVMIEDSLMVITMRGGN